LSEKEEENESLKNDLDGAKSALANLGSNMEEGITSYESATVKMKNALSEKRQENEALHNDLDKAKSALADLEAKMEERMSEDSKTIVKSSPDSGSQTSPVPKQHDPELDSLRKANRTLKEKSKNLTRELVDSTKAFEETITSYETVIAKVKNALLEKKQEHEALKDELRERVDSAKAVEETITSYESVIAEGENALSEKEEENESLKNDLDGAKSALANLGSNMEEGITSYESATVKMKNALSEKRQENEALHNDLDKAKSALADLEAKMDEGMSEDIKTIVMLEELQAQTLETHEKELNAYREAVDVLKKKLEEGIAAYKALEADKNVLALEVDRLNDDFATVISQFEEELTLSCEASEAALRQTHDECEATKAVLREKQEEYSQLATELADCEENERESAGLVLQHEATIHELRGELNQTESEKHELEKSKDELIDKIASLTEEAEENQTEIEQLKCQFVLSIDEKTQQEVTIHELRGELSGKESKLEGAMLSIDENTQFYEQLRADCTQLKEEKETAKEELQTTMAKEQDLASQLEVKSTQLADLQQKMDENKSNHLQERDRIKEQVSKMSEAVEVTANHRDKARSELKEASAAIDGLSKINDDAHIELVNLKEKSQKRQVEIDKLNEARAELTAKIASLTGENGHLRTQMEQNKQTVSFVENQIGSIREEARAAEEGRQNAVLAAKAAEDEQQNAALSAKAVQEELRRTTSKINDMVACNESNERQLRSLREEVRMADEARQKASMAVDATQDELLNATTRLDDMLTYTGKLKVGHEKTTASLRNEMDEQMTSMKEVIQSLQSQVKIIESDKEENRKMYEKDISLQQVEVETLKLKHTDALTNLDSLTELVANLKAALDSEKANAQILLQQFKRSEQDRKSHVGQKEEVEAELASRLKSESAKTARIRSLEGVEKELASRMKSENIMTERIRNLETELQELRPITQAKEEELNELRASMMEKENLHKTVLVELKSKVDGDKRKYTTMQERISYMESHTKSLQQEFKHTLHKKEEEGSKLRVVLQEAKDKLGRLWDENEDLKNGNDDSMQSLQHMLNDAIRSRANTDASLQESLQLLEQQKRIDIKRKGEIAKLEQTVEILKSKERYLESYVASLKKQIRRG